MSVAGLCILLLVLRYPDLKLSNYLQTLLVFTWGFRLGYYLIKRESNANYNSRVRDQTDSSQELKIPVKAGIWFSVSFMYICMFSPVVFTLQQSLSSQIVTLIITASGLLIMAAGTVIEAVADSQKVRFKEKNPKTFCSTGLYSWVRCPNYLGEILVWTGNYVCALSYCSTWWQWTLATLGVVSIVLVMMGSTKRQEKKQSETYDKDPAFRKYEKSVPVLFPWVPVYSLQKIRVFLE
jgi:steroid 5-alpha reductase family enzyme